MPIKKTPSRGPKPRASKNRASEKTKRFIEIDELTHSKRETELLSKVLSLIYVHTGIDVTHYKLTTVFRRIQRQMALHNFNHLEEYANFLESRPEEIKRLHDDLFIHVTEFFRDVDSFEVLRDTIVPQLVKNRRSGVPLRIWVPGCSTGEEAYSLAIILLEFAEERKIQLPFQIFATDISEDTLEFARAGVFTKQQVENVPDDLLKKYFDAFKDSFKVKKTLRTQFVFSRHDVTVNPPFAKIDLITCRNVLIYFSPTLQQRVMPVFHYALNSKGYLWLGRSEAPTGISKLFSCEDKVHKIYSKITTSPARFHFPHLRLGERASSDRKSIDVTSVLTDQNREIDRAIMNRFAPPCVVVNSDFEIVQVRGKTAPFIQIANGQATLDLMRMVRPELLSGLRHSLQTAIREKKSVIKHGLPFENGETRKLIDLEVAPLNPTAEPKEILYLVAFVDSPEKGTPLPKKPAARPNSTGARDEEYLQELLQEIDSLREYQQSLAEGYETSREELTASNEELQSTLEEFQSNNEELETAKEELQASNEELTTINGELQTRAEELSASEERFRLLIDSVNDYALYMLDTHGNVSTWNEGARRFYGYEADEILGKHFVIFYPKELQKSDRPSIEIETARTQGRFEEEGIRVRKDGSTFFANAILTAIRDDSGNLRGFAKITRDISERKVAERTLLESEERYRLMIEVVKDYAIIRLDSNGNIVTWNEGAKNLKGYEARDVKGKHFSIFYSKDDVENGKPAWELQQAENTGRLETEGWRVRKDGSKFWANVLVTAIHDGGQNLVGFTQVTRDLTVRKLAEEKLQQSEERFRLLVEGVAEYAIFMLNPDFTVASWNDGARRIKLYQASEIMGKHFSIFYPPEDIKNGKVEYEMNEATTTGRVEDEGWRIKKDGTKFWASVVINRITDRTGKIIGFSKITRDLTERKRLYDELYAVKVDLEKRVLERTEELTEAVQSRDEFMSVASHELKTPLTAIRLYSQIVQRSIQRGENKDDLLRQVGEFAGKIDIQVDRLRQLIEDMLDVTRIQHGKLSLHPEPTNFSTLLADIIDRYGPEFDKAQCSVTSRIEPDINGTWDRYRIEQIILNLFSNATKYGSKHPVEIRAWKSDTTVKLAVKDFGIGIAPQDVERIFKRFERAISAHEITGLGLGLYITSEILKVHQGTIAVATSPGNGSEFEVTLPLNPTFAQGSVVEKDFEF